MSRYCCQLIAVEEAASNEESAIRSGLRFEKKTVGLRLVVDGTGDVS